MEIDTLIRHIVNEIVDARLNGHASEPVLITAEEAAKLCGVGKDTIVSLAHGAAENGFPAVWLSSRLLKIDKTRLTRWFAGGGLGVKA